MTGKLPKLNLPHYKTILPFSGQEVKYRPYTVAEEKILSTAIATEDPKVMEDAGAHIIANCCGVDVETLHPADLEWLFLKLRSAAMGSVVKVSMSINCGESCPTEIKTSFNLETDVILEGEADLIEAGFQKRKDGWVVMFDETIGAVFDIRSVRDADEKKALYSSLVYVFNGDEVTTKEDITAEELYEWVETGPSDIGDKIKVLFAAQPFLMAKVTGRCPACNTVHTTNITGLLDFFG